MSNKIFFLLSLFCVLISSCENEDDMVTSIPLFSDTQNATMWLVAMFGIVLTVLSALLANKILK